jgi:hypothetical protein
MEKLRQILVELGFTQSTFKERFWFYKSIPINLGMWNFDVSYIEKTNVIRVHSHYDSYYTGIEQYKKKNKWQK